jgi:hypothetical protein
VPLLVYIILNSSHLSRGLWCAENLVDGRTKLLPIS